MHIETHKVDFDLMNYKGVQNLPYRQTHNRRNCRQYQIFSEHLCRGFVRIKAQNFNGGNFAYSLCNVDVRQVIENNEG